MRSPKILKQPEQSIIRIHYKAMGYTDEDLSRPIIGIANAWSSAVPGHVNLRSVAAAVSDGIRMAGGTPVEFGVIGACDGISEGHPGKRYVLPTRDVIADSIELMVQAHHYDAVVLLGSCDKIVPGMLMAAARLDLPAIFLNGGPMYGGPFVDGRKSDSTSVIEGVGRMLAGQIGPEEVIYMENHCAPGCGSCSMLGTANSMACLAEALGMSLPGSAMIPAASAARLAMAQATGRAVVELTKRDLTARRIITPEAIENAVRLVSAIGGSTNTALHVPAIAYEAELNFDLDLFDRLSRSTPLLAKMNPSAAANVIDFYESGGVSAVMGELAPLMHLEALSVNGRTLGENLAGQKSPDNEVIKTLAAPFESSGGLGILRGNIAPLGAVTKPAAIDPSQRVFQGSAICFNSEEEADEAIMAGRVEAGQVLVIRYEGPKGGPGMPEMFRPLKLLHGLGLARQTALITDGRFSGTNNGCFVGHISPEAQEGGIIALIEDGDQILIDIPAQKLELLVGPELLAERRRNWTPPPPRVAKGYLYRYARQARSAALGAVLPSREE